jgi:colanic acid biosynthesis glycosyl transferase WcaI
MQTKDSRVADEAAGPKADPEETIGTILVLSQVYVPDPTSVGQHMASAARELRRRGWRVVVYTSARGFNDSSKVYPSRETLDGVDVRRLPLCSFGKGRVALRLLGAFMFVAQAALRGLFVRDLRAVVVSTSPPFCPIAALILHFFRRVPFLFWSMDVNPDQAVKIGWAREEALSTRAFHFLNRKTLKHATRIVALDRFMADRLAAKTECRDRLTVLPPWPLDRYLDPVPHDGNPFRRKHDLTDKFVVMYSGNMGATSNVQGLVEVARRLVEEEDIVFLLVGGGVGMEEVRGLLEQAPLPNLVTLPYQPLDELCYSLSAADLHVVTMADAVVGINHPCKVYGAMAVERPVLFLGPNQSHIGDLLGQWELGWRAPIDDLERITETVLMARDAGAEERRRRGSLGRVALAEGLDESQLRGQFVDLVELTARSGS